uniref:CSON002829 protein n=1 Tax=Culicoides sonorensis TaxID=179676 RepID=A0A336LVY5_CULSO
MDSKWTNFLVNSEQYEVEYIDDDFDEVQSFLSSALGDESTDLSNFASPEGETSNSFEEKDLSAESSMKKSLRPTREKKTVRGKLLQHVNINSDLAHATD